MRSKIYTELDFFSKGFSWNSENRGQFSTNENAQQLEKAKTDFH